MKKVCLSAILLGIFSLSIFAQAKVDFSGNWDLDKAKSRMDERQARGIESQSLKVVHGAMEIKVSTTTKRAEIPPSPNGGMPGGQGGRPGGGMGRGGFGGMMGDSAYTYQIGKETTMQQSTPMGEIPVVLSAKMEGASLKLSQSRSISGPMGDFTLVTKEEWSLSSDGKTLTIKRESDSPRGPQNSELIYTKAAEMPAATDPAAGAAAQPSGEVAPAKMPKMVNAGIVNGKALNLAKPSYPDDARSAGAQGAVKVKIVIDEEGNVVEAQAVEGHEMLRKVSEEAAKASSFMPTKLAGKPVKVQGFIVYNFASGAEVK